MDYIHWRKKNLNMFRGQQVTNHAMIAFAVNIFIGALMQDLAVLLVGDLELIKGLNLPVTSVLVNIPPIMISYHPIHGGILPSLSAPMSRLLPLSQRSSFPAALCLFLLSD